MRVLIWTLLILLPLATAAFGWPLWLVAILLAGLLLARWLTVLAGLGAKPKGPELCLETIGASHFVEKVRWCMDRLGLDYDEQVWAGTLGAFFKGRSVPTLHVQSGFGRWSISNSSDILRYLWGRYAAELGDRAQFLEPTRERLELEQRLDRYGVALQTWVYYHLLPHRQATLRAWGAEDSRTPAWQRWLIRLLFPLHRALVGRAFRANRRGYEGSCEQIEGLLADMNQRLAGNAESVTGDSEPCYVDFTFAALSALWLQPDEFASGRSTAVRIDDCTPDGMLADRKRWCRDFPEAVAFVESLYRERRLTA